MNSHFSDQELDSLFKEAAAANKAPAFDDAYWAEMEALLPTKKRRGIVFWFTVTGIPIVLGLAGFSVYNWNTSDTRLISKVQSDQPKTNVPNKQETKSHCGSPYISDPVQIIYVNNKIGYSQPVSNLNSQVSESIISSDQNLIDPNFENQNKYVANDVSQTTILSRRPFLFTHPVTLNDVERMHSSGRSLPIYVDFGLGYGQSYRHIDFENNWMSQFKIGAGLYTQLGNMDLSAGLDFRVEVPTNISRKTITQSTQPSSVESEITNLRGIYSLEFPLYAGGNWGRSSLGGTMTPGIQLGFSGTKLNYENTAIVGRERVVGAIPDSKSLTMEFGLRYGYMLTEHLQFAGSMNVDVIRPFQSDTYSGETTNLPMSFFLGLRRRF